MADEKLVSETALTQFATDIKTALNAIASGATFKESVKQALLACFANVAWANEHGQDCYDALEEALYEKSVVSINAVFVQGGAVIYNTDSLSVLRDYLTVRAVYDDTTSAVVTGYTLSGTLTAGTSTITVFYGGFTTTFNVTVTQSPLIHRWDFTQSLNDLVGSATAVLNNCSRSSDGVTFDGQTDNIVLGEVFGFDKTLEIDYTNATIQATNKNAIFFWTNPNTLAAGFGYHYSSIPANNKFAYYTPDTGHWIYSNYDRTSFNGSGTIKLTISSTGKVHVYKDGTNLFSEEPLYNNESDASYITLGSNTSNYPAFYNCKIKEVRIYEGVES